ncbi:hypothetical protein LTR99_008758 [Exophiala xenobiotica]|uniref:DUF6603 domain-containing protein n=1 Tax=Vermiconidia calcicola TaxID=1690605 RepID=A0AAV9Q1H4_9PEZI|nr:hypothetical protein LTR96_009028 [Exophiala xenobiotica]KAK5533402.1 hypothetical protein LTR25_007268 [Vermiconidia calcicola]KAK5542864.1 hypothetical protein LTR23_005189 [Chaetothyriales sp. CCFEE 6169]KAK5296391.1 hypothetical protein LTR99_008758 [Exophiala xenobiotica]KAK5334444.1 hypothetical protein LTR98_009398 [Exophiala xenobiotica]
MADYNVHSFHINVGAGDAAIYLLVDARPASSPGRAGGHVLSAVWVDGGKNSASDIQVAPVFETIAAAYTLDTPNVLQFDSIIITHWDHDHYGGIVGLIRHDADLISSGRCSFMKYNTRTRPPTPLTTLYAPYWSKEETRTDCTKGASQYFRRRVGTGRGGEYFLDVNGETGGWQNKVARLCTGARNLIGRDFFVTLDPGNSRPPLSAVNSLGIRGDRRPYSGWPDPSSMMGFGYGKPGFWCIGADGDCPGRAHTRAELPMPNKHGVGIIPGTEDPSNRTSIIAAVMWPSTAPSGKIKVKLYTGGDASDATETFAAQWLYTPSIAGGPTIQPDVPVHKLGHHGAATATPMVLLDSFNSKIMIISAGTQYGHPRWEILFYKKVINDLRVKGGWSSLPQPLYPMGVPPWLTRDPARRIGDFIGNINTTDFRNTPFQTAVVEKIRTIGAPLLMKAISNTAADARLAETTIRTRLETAWSDLSSIREPPFPGSTAYRASPILYARRLKFHFVRLREEDGAEDGQSFYWGGRTNPPIEAWQPIAAPTPPPTTAPAAAPGRRHTRAAARARGATAFIPPVPVGGSPTVAGSATFAVGRTTMTKRRRLRRAVKSEAFTDDQLRPDPLPIPGHLVLTEDSNFYFLSSVWGTVAQSDKIESVAAQADVNEFSCWLKNGALAISATPSNVEKAVTDLSPNDEWAYWMEESGLQAQSVSVITSPSPTNRFAIEGFTVSLALQPWSTTGAPATSKTTTFPWNLAFSTACLDLVFPTSLPDQTQNAGPGKVAAFSLPATGLLDGTAILMLGLDTGMLKKLPSPLQCTISDICSVFQLGGGLQVFAGLLDDFVLQLDQSTSSRNAIWFAPAVDYTTFLRLQFVPTSGTASALNSLLQKAKLGITVTNPKVIARLTARQLEMSAGDNAFGTTFDSDMIIAATFGSASSSHTFDGYLAFEAETINLTLQWTNKHDPTTLGDILKWLNGLLNDCLPEVSIPADLMSKIQSWLSAVYIREICFSITTSGGLSVRGFSIAFEIPMSVGGSTDGVAAFMMSFSYPGNDFVGMLRTAMVLDDFDDFTRTLLPYHEDYLTLAPLSSPLVDGIPLTSLIPGHPLSALPRGIPDTLDSVSLEVNSTFAMFQATISCDMPKQGTPPPIGVIDEVAVQARYDFAAGMPSVSLYADVTLSPRPASGASSSAIPSAILEVQFDWQKGAGWTLTGQVQDLTLALLYSYVEPDCGSAMMDLLEMIEAKYLQCTYTYVPDGGNTQSNATSFTFTGIILLGELELELDYSYPADGAWTFKAMLGLESPGSTVRSVVRSLCGSEAASLIPDCVNFDISAASGPSPAARAFNDSPVQLEVQKVLHPTTGSTSLVFTLELDLGDFSITVLQIQDSSAAQQSLKPKRLVRFRLGSFPKLNGIPIVNDIDPPFDELDYLWVHDNNTGDKIGIARGDFETINQMDLFRSQPLRCKDDSKPPKPGEQPDQTRIMLQVGSHFIVGMNQKVVLDYVFGQPTEPTPDPPTTLRGIITSRKNLTDDGDDDSIAGPAQKAPMKKSIGPLSICNFGLHFANSELTMLVDATVLFGPVGFTLLQFGVTFNLSGVKLDWASLKKLIPSPTIAGLGVQCALPGVEISGIFEYKNGIYTGGLSAVLAPYMILAAGGFGSFTDPHNNTFDAAFMYGEVDGPLANVAGIEFTNAKLGFGVNSAVKNPDLTNIANFPFIRDSADTVAATINPLSLLNLFMQDDPNGQQWILYQRNKFWLAAGCDALAFELVEISAIVVFGFDPYVSLSIFAKGVAALPDTTGGREGAFLWAEFGCIEAFVPSTGTFVNEGCLTPNSFVLDPSCHLLGGYAVCFWAPPSPFAGDTVVSLGGYHPAFQAPPHYPVLPRLGVYWGVDSNINITGEVYTALTGKAIMCGGKLSATFSAGPLGAWFDAWADFLINYQPFHYSIDVGVSVGVSFTLDLWICTIYISCSIGASLFIQGPPFQGTVHVDFWVFGFDINFGGGQISSDQLDFPSLLSLLRQSKWCNPNPPTATGPNDVHMLMHQTGVVPSAGQTSVPRITPWVVRSGTFSFCIRTRFAIQNSTCNGVTVEAATKDKIHSKPMHIAGDICSELVVTIDNGDPDFLSSQWRLTPMMDRQPKAVWGEYVAGEDPNSQGNDIPEILNADTPTSTLMMGTTFLVPKERKHTDGIPEFNAIEDMKYEVSDDLPIKPFLPLPPPTQAVGNPTAQPSTEGQVATAWKTAGATTVASDLATAWAGLFSWGDAAASGISTAAPTGILLNAWDTYYLVDPDLALPDTTPDWTPPASPATSIAVGA